MSRPADSGCGLHVEVVGGGQRPILALHGLGGEHGQPLALLTGDVRAANRILAPDLRGHGATRLTCSAATMNFAQLAADTEELVTELHHPPSPLTVIGISMGAAVAIELLARRTIPVSAAVLIRPAWMWTPHPRNLAVFATIAELLQTHGPDEGGRRFRDSDRYADISRVSEPAARALLGQFSAPEALGRVQRLIAMPSSAPSRPPADGVAGIPTLIIGSEQDPVHPLAVARQLSEEWQVPLDVVPPRYDEPELHARAVTTAIHRFLRDT